MWSARSMVKPSSLSITTGTVTLTLSKPPSAMLCPRGGSADAIHHHCSRRTRGRCQHHSPSPQPALSLHGHRCHHPRLSLGLLIMSYIRFRRLWVMSYDDYQDDERFETLDEAVEAATDWSAMVGGDIITISFIEDGKLYPHMEVFA